MNCIATRACPSCALLCAASRVYPPCGVKPGNDSFEKAKMAQYASLVAPYGLFIVIY
jgi:hypothetical protein